MSRTREERGGDEDRRAGAGPEPVPARTVGPLRALWDQVSTLVLAVLIALAIRAFVIEPFRIPSGSMLPTLLIGDHLFVNKFVYGIRIPRTAIRLPGLRLPERGDVVVFSVGRSGNSICPADRCPDQPRDSFVKRIVGLPGDTLEVIDGRVFLNGAPVAVQEDGETFADESGRPLQMHREQLDAHAHAVLADPALARSQHLRFQVEPGRYFMMGDNRDHSNDSRYWGTVRLAELKGPAFVLYWSWDFDGSWLSMLSPLTWWELLTEKMRWERIGDRVR